VKCPPSAGLGKVGFANRSFLYDCEKTLLPTTRPGIPKIQIPDAILEPWS